MDLVRGATRGFAKNWKATSEQNSDGNRVSARVPAVLDPKRWKEVSSLLLGGGDQDIRHPGILTAAAAVLLRLSTDLFSKSTSGKGPSIRKSEWDRELLTQSVSECGVALMIDYGDADSSPEVSLEVRRLNSAVVLLFTIDTTADLVCTLSEAMSYLLRCNDQSLGEDRGLFVVVFSGTRDLLVRALLLLSQKQKAQANPRKSFTVFVQKCMSPLLKLLAACAGRVGHEDIVALVHKLAAEALFANPHNFLEIAKYFVDSSDLGEPSQSSDQHEPVVKRRRRDNKGGMQDSVSGENRRGENASFVDSLFSQLREATLASMKDDSRRWEVVGYLDLLPFFVREFSRFRALVHRLPAFGSALRAPATEKRKRPSPDGDNDGNSQVERSLLSHDFSCFSYCHRYLEELMHNVLAHTFAGECLSSAARLYSTLEEAVLDEDTNELVAAKIYTAENIDQVGSASAHFEELRRCAAKDIAAGHRFHADNLASSGLFSVATTLLRIEHRLFTENEGAVQFSALWESANATVIDDDVNQGLDSFCIESVGLFSRLRQIDGLVFDVWKIGQPEELVNVSTILQRSDGFLISLAHAIQQMPPMQSPIFFERLSEALAQSPHKTSAQFRLVELVAQNVAVNSAQVAESWNSNVTFVEERMGLVMNQCITADPSYGLARETMSVIHALLELRFHCSRYISGLPSATSFSDLLLGLVQTVSENDLPQDSAQLFIEDLINTGLICSAVDSDFAEAIWKEILAQIQRESHCAIKLACVAIIPFSRDARPSVMSLLLEVVREILASVAVDPEVRTIALPFILDPDLYEDLKLANCLFDGLAKIVKNHSQDLGSLIFALNCLGRVAPFQAFYHFFATEGRSKKFTSWCTDILADHSAECHRSRESWTVVLLSLRVLVRAQQAGIAFDRVREKIREELLVVFQGLSLLTSTVGGADSLFSVAESTSLLVGRISPYIAPAQTEFLRFANCFDTAAALRAGRDSALPAELQREGQELLESCLASCADATNYTSRTFQEWQGELRFLAEAARHISRLTGDDKQTIRKVFYLATELSVYVPTDTSDSRLSRIASKVLRNLLLRSDVPRSQLAKFIKWTKKGICVPAELHLSTTPSRIMIGSIVSVRLLFTGLASTPSRGTRADLLEHHKYSLLLQVAVAVSALVNLEFSDMRDLGLCSALEACCLAVRALPEKSDTAHVCLSIVLQIASCILGVVPVAAPDDADGVSCDRISESLYWCLHAVLGCRPRASVVSSAGSLVALLCSLLRESSRRNVMLLSTTGDRFEESATETALVASRNRAARVSRLLAVFASQAQFSKYCVYLLVEIVGTLQVLADRDPPADDLRRLGDEVVSVLLSSENAHRAVREALLPGIYALLDALSDRELSHCFVCLKSETDRVLFRRLHTDWKQDHKHRGKV